MKKISFIIFAVLVLFSGWQLMFKRDDPAQNPPRVIEVGMGMTVKNFIERNRLEMGKRVPQGYGIDVDKLTDVMPIFFDDNWIALRFLDGAQSFNLPPGRTLQVSQRAGRVIGISFRPFAQPRPLKDMIIYVNELLGTLEKEGWKPTSPSTPPANADDFDSAGKNIFAEMVATSGSKLQMTLRDYGLAPRHESFILLPDPTYKPAESSRTYLLEVDVMDYDGRVYEELIYPRRLFETSDLDKAIPLRRWIENPDWFPEKAGMVPTSSEERAQPDFSNWKMPSR
ncbi:hypothetical protein [Agrobacterium sp. lyk4-40-TYG-31]|uniref:hypothetical protein n=1 Tax=Agrobacterium sp. lyk4-40-TYG-31 TaxID=3040276 RepID=UPI002550B8A7|nr:hypothetical protein [Agrobacterium sp. lyk4-40-TYG-31]